MKAYASIENIQLAMKLTNVSKKSTLPILGQVKITASHDKIEIVGTDFVVTTRITVPALVEEDGTALMDFSKIKKVIDSGKKKDHVLFTEDSVKAGRASANIHNRFEIEDFPEIQKIGEETCGVCFPSIPEFARQLGNAIKTTSNDESRRILTTVNISHENGAARLVATDSYRLYVGNSIGMFRGEGVMNISKSVAEIIMKAEKSLREVEISHHYDHDRTILKLDDKMKCEIISRSVDGNYPNWKQLFADSYDYSCDIERKTLDDGVKFIKKMAKSTTPVMLDFSNCRISCNEEGSGTYSYDVEAGSTEDPHDRYVNVAYLAEALASSKEKTITMRTLDSPYKPMVFENPEGDMMLVMPVRVA